MSSKPKKILFLSGIDFKEKSIQVIKKTPQAFYEKGWHVDYIVLRDTSKGGNYFYETPLTPPGVNVIRLNYKGASILNSISNHTCRTVLNKAITNHGISQLYDAALKRLELHAYDVIYGYEHIGTLAVKRLKEKGKISGIKTVSRFQGTWMSKYHKEKNTFKLLANSDFKTAMKFKSDLLIMTDDGTQGDYILNQWNPSHPNIKFWVNGVDIPEIKESSKHLISEKLNLHNKLTLVSISRLEGWKRVDRGIDIIKTFVENHPDNKDLIKYIIVGDGVDKDKLESRVATHKLNEQIHFTGAISHSEVGNYLSVADIFLSFYDLSNVGNPLLEAIRSGEIIMTLANGDTPKWISHLENGFIYDPNSAFISQAAEDLNLLVKNEQLINSLKAGVNLLAEKKLWTWAKRLTAEVREVESLL